MSAEENGQQNKHMFAEARSIEEHPKDNERSGLDQYLKVRKQKQIKNIQNAYVGNSAMLPFQNLNK